MVCCGTEIQSDEVGAQDFSCCVISEDATFRGTLSLCADISLTPSGTKCKLLEVCYWEYCLTRSTFLKEKWSKSYSQATIQLIVCAFTIFSTARICKYNYLPPSPRSPSPWHRTKWQKYFHYTNEDYSWIRLHRRRQERLHKTSLLVDGPKAVEV